MDEGQYDGKVDVWSLGNLYLLRFGIYLTLNYRYYVYRIG